MSTPLTILAPHEWHEQATAEWLWHGYLAAGNITLLASQWKAGKTTLLAALLARLQTGGELAGLAVKPARAVVLSEESPALWQMRHQRFHFGDHIGLVCRPFRGKPTNEEWAALIDQLAEQHATAGLDLLVIDPLISFLPGRSENDAIIMAEALLPLQQLLTQGMAVLILHHTRKATSADGKMARGSGALAGFVDILMEMHWYGCSQSADRRRRIQAWSRYSETPRQLILEWTEDGNYLARGEEEDENFRGHWELLHRVLAQAERKLTRDQIAQRWPEGEETPARISLWRWLSRAVDEGRIQRSGTGHRHDPYRYWLPEREAEFGVSRGLLDLPPLEGLG
ncbi:MAG TPA: AAA family ATPase [Gemmataceae bacterium]|nr:AAA family ATPase [Gemmataceae bacterium]